MNSWTTNSTSGIPSGWTIFNYGVEFNPTIGFIPQGYVTFTANENGSLFGLVKKSTNQTIYLSKNGRLWQSINAYDVFFMDEGDIFYVCGDLTSANTSSNYTQFYIFGNISTSGNCNMIWNKDNPDAVLLNYCGYYMFRNCTGLTGAPELPAETLASYCYYGMFYNCNTLRNVPTLPATTLANYCYQGMFSGCTSLETVPSNLLPATTLATYCYQGMFNECTSLEEAPELLASTLVSSCYYRMFYNCSSLKKVKCLATSHNASNCTKEWLYGTAPFGTFLKSPDSYWATDYTGSNVPSYWSIINYPSTEFNPTIEFTPYGYVTFTVNQDNSKIGISKKSTNHTIYFSKNGTLWQSMNAYDVFDANNGDVFYVCGNLTANNNSSNYTQFHISGSVSASGNCNAIWNKDNLNAELLGYCGYNMFCGCQGLTTAPSLSATTLANYCYYQMFYGCTSLTTVPELPATTLADYCYSYMFAQCKNLITVPTNLLPATTLAYYCYSQMFSNCTKLTNVPNLPTQYTQYSANIPYGIYSGMFYRCSSLKTVPSDLLPSTKLSQRCYNSMFQDCTSLITAPKLSASTLTQYCYYQMFYNCSKLSNVTCLATDISASNCISSWLFSVNSIGVFTKAPSMSSWPSGASGIPSNWTVQNYT